MEVPRSIHKLSPEVLSLIAQHLDFPRRERDWDTYNREESDLSNFRLVCKGFLAASNVPFGKRHFSKIRLLCTEESLKTFVEIVQNPRIEPYIDTVLIDAIRLTPHGGNTHTYNRGSNECANLPGPDHGRQLGVQERFVASGQEQLLLSHALSILHRPLHLGVWASIAGFQGLCNERSDRHWRTCWTKLALAEAFRTCIHAAFASNTRITELSIDADLCIHHTIAQDLHLDDISSMALKHVITSVNGFNISALLDDDNDYIDELYHSLLALNSLASEASSYSINATNIWDNIWDERTAILKPFKNLRNLTLTALHFKEDVLIDIITCQAHSLRKLTFQGFSLPSRQSWRNVLTFISHMPCLTALRVDDPGVLDDGFRGQGFYTQVLDKSWTTPEDARRDIEAFAGSLGRVDKSFTDYAIC